MKPTTRTRQSDEIMRRLERQAAATVAIGHAAISSDDLNALLDQAVRQVAEALDNEFCKVLKLEPDGKTLSLIAGIGWKEGLVGHASVPGGRDSQAGFTLKTKGPVIVEDLRTDRRFNGPQLLTDHGVVSGISTVIGPEASPWGVLGSHSTRSERFTANDANFIQSAANLLWDAILRQESHQRLRESEERFRHVADSAPVMIWLSDSTDCTFANRAYLDFLGVSEASAVSGFEWAQYVHPEDREAYLATYRDACDRLARFEARFRFLRHDGEYRWMQSVGMPRLTQSAGFLGYAGCTYDIHEEQRALTALRNADRRKEEFLGILGHELRNPLAPLRTGIDLLHRDFFTPEKLDSIRSMMERQLSHLTRLVDDLLDVSRISRGKIQLRTAPLELDAVIETAVEQTKRLIDAGDHKLVIERTDAPLPVDGDFARLTQVVGNLLANAAKYSEPEGTITLRTETDDGQACLHVRDTGFGVPAERLEDIFEMFSQVADHRSQTGGGGLGIGLPLSRLLVTLHKGTIEARSEGLGRGSEFIVRLPLGEPVDPSRKAAEPVADSGMRRCRVLVVDDNADAASSLCMMLEQQGHSVRIEFDGPAALEADKDFAPQVVLLDLGLPHIDGFEVARRLRASRDGGRRLLIAISGWGQEEDKRRARDAGFDCHLTKPLNYTELQALIAEYLESLPEAEGE